MKNEQTSNNKIANLHQLLDSDIQKCCSAEHQLQVTLEQWVDKAVSAPLKMLLQHYRNGVTKQMEQLEKFTREEQLPSISLSNRIMRALISETEERLKKCSDNEVSDACLLASVQQINHIKISIYGTAAAFARAIGNTKASTMFHTAEVQEKTMDEQLSELAKKDINLRAISPILLSEKE